MAFICDVVLFGVFSDKTVSLRTFHQGQITSFVSKTERLSRQPVPGVVVQSGSYVLFRVWNLVKGLQSQKTKNITDVKIKALELKLVLTLLLNVTHTQKSAPRFISPYYWPVCACLQLLLSDR